MKLSLTKIDRIAALTIFRFKADEREGEIFHLNEKAIFFSSQELIFQRKLWASETSFLAADKAGQSF